MKWPAPVTLCLVMLMGGALYGIGYWHGQHRGDFEGSSQPLPVGASPTARPGTGPAAGVDSGQPDAAGSFEGLIHHRAWFKLERWLTENRTQLTVAHGQALHQALSRNLNKYDALSMRRVLRAYLDGQPNDTQALFLLSDLQTMGGMSEAALESLFRILDFPAAEEDVAQARLAIGRLLSVLDAELRGRGAVVERAAFWEHLSSRMPADDYYRYRWAGALVDLGDFQQARRVLAETGTHGVSQQDLDLLAQQIEAGISGPQFRREGERLLATAFTDTGMGLTLMVDTGANITSLNRTVLRTMAARRRPERARIRTANGVVETGVYQIALLEVSGRRFEDVTVLELPVELPELDGLLGLDLVNQLTANPFEDAR